MQKKSMKNSNNGITLIALVLTIIVMIILAGISINALVGDNGVLNQAQLAKIKHEDEGVKETVQLAWSAGMSKFYEDLAAGKASYNDIGRYINVTTLNSMLGGNNGTITSVIENGDRIL